MRFRRHGGSLLSPYVDGGAWRQIRLLCCTPHTTMGIFCCGAAPAEPPTDEAYKAAELILALSKRDRGKVMKAANKKSRLEKKAEKKAAKAEKKAAKQAKKAAKKGGKGDKKGKGKGGQKDEGDALLDEIDMPETAV